MKFLDGGVRFQLGLISFPVADVMGGGMSWWVSWYDEIHGQQWVMASVVSEVAVVFLRTTIRHVGSRSPFRAGSSTWLLMTKCWFFRMDTSKLDWVHIWLCNMHDLILVKMLQNQSYFSENVHLSTHKTYEFVPCFIVVWFDWTTKLKKETP